MKSIIFGLWNDLHSAHLVVLRMWNFFLTLGKDTKSNLKGQGACSCLEAEFVKIKITRTSVIAYLRGSWCGCVGLIHFVFYISQNKKPKNKTKKKPKWEHKLCPSSGAAPSGLNFLSVDWWGLPKPKTQNKDPFAAPKYPIAVSFSILNGEFRCLGLKSKSLLNVGVILFLGD